jgi:hypothetical protein
MYTGRLIEELMAAVERVENRWRGKRLNWNVCTWQRRAKK